MAIPAPVAISLQHVSKRFENAPHAAVERLSLDVRAGELLALIGPSGCGKTTTLRMINRLTEPTSGTIEVLGRPHDDRPTHQLRRQIGYVIQQIGLFPHRTIRRNIGTVPELLKWGRQRIDARTDELVELVGLDRELLDRYPAELSGGQQQRVGVARALAADPPILLMDEPYSAVDPIVRERLQAELLSLQSKVRKTIVLVTHDIDEAIRLADRIAVLNVGGVLEQCDTPDDLLSRPASGFVAAFLGRERGLRRLALRSVADIDTFPGPVVSAASTVRYAIDVGATQSSDWVAVVDEGVLRGWISIADLGSLDPASFMGNAEIRPFAAQLGRQTPLREALDVIISSHAQVAAVVESGRFLGMVSLEQIAKAMS